MEYITNLKESKLESQYGLISVYNMVYRTYGKEIADELNNSEDAKKAYHQHILNLRNKAKKNGWYVNSLKSTKGGSAYAGDSNLNMKYSKWWLEKMVSKYDPVETIMFVSKKA